MFSGLTLRLGSEGGTSRALTTCGPQGFSDSRELAASSSYTLSWQRIAYRIVKLDIGRRSIEAIRLASLARAATPMQYWFHLSCWDMFRTGTSVGPLLVFNPPAFKIYEAHTLPIEIGVQLIPAQAGSFRQHPCLLLNGPLTALGVISTHSRQAKATLRRENTAWSCPATPWVTNRCLGSSELLPPFGRQTASRAKKPDRSRKSQRRQLPWHRGVTDSINFKFAVPDGRCNPWAPEADPSQPFRSRLGGCAHLTACALASATPSIDPSETLLGASVAHALPAWPSRPGAAGLRPKGRPADGMCSPSDRASKLNGPQHESRCTGRGRTAFDFRAFRPAR